MIASLDDGMTLTDSARLDIVIDVVTDRWPMLASGQKGGDGRLGPEVTLDVGHLYKGLSQLFMNGIDLGTLLVPRLGGCDRGT